MLHSLPDLVSIAIILIIARLAINWLRSLFDAIAVGRLSLPGVHPETAPATRRIVIVMVWLFAGAAIYPHLPGSGTDAFKGLSVLAGVLVTFGSSGIVGQAMSGLLLIYTRGFRVGDFIKVGDVEGTVVELGMLATRVRTVRNEYVSIPNNVVVSGSVTGYSTAGREQKALFASATVTIGYDSPWRQIHELLIRAAQRTDGCVAEPAPFVLQKGLNDWYVAYELNAPVDPARATELPYIRARLNENIQDSFWEAGVEIMSPSYFALRDGNTVTIPPEHRPPNPPGAFRVSVEPK
jgi:small-conductance mechanosensitive channel